MDSRFDRRRYSADRTVAAFAARLKDAMDVTAGRDDLTSVVQQTPEPAHVSLWIRPPPRRPMPAAVPHHETILSGRNAC